MDKIMTVKKISEVHYKESRVKIGTRTIEAINETIETDRSDLDKNETDKKPEVDIEQLKFLYQNEIEKIESDVRAAAKKQGYEEGLVKAQKETDASNAEKISELDKKLELIESLDKALVEKSEAIVSNQKEQLLEVIFSIIGNLIEEPSFYKDLVSKTIEAAATTNKEQVYTIFVHPNDKHFIESEVLTDKSDKYKVVEDKSLNNGGIYIETDNCTLDARLEIILSNVKKLLRAKYDG